MFFGMDLLMLFQILRPLERLVADSACMGLQRSMYCERENKSARPRKPELNSGRLTSKMAGNMVSLRTHYSAIFPTTSKTQVVG